MTQKVRYGRDYPQDQPISEERLEAALLKVAHLMADDAGYAPIFERLEAELEKATSVEEKLSEAQQHARDLIRLRSNRQIQQEGRRPL